jgi:glycosyltransferase involved in cell wall biosynthesis
MKKVLIFTYYWPPASGPGVQRFLKFCKYLPEFGWKPYVITVDNGTYSSTDESLKNDVPEIVEVIKTKTSEPFAVYNKMMGKEKKSATVGMIDMDGKKSLLKRLSVYARANFFIPDARKGWNKFAYNAAIDLIKKENINTVITTGPPQSTHLIGLKLKKQLDVKWVADFRDPWTTVYYNDMLPRTESTKKKDKKLEDKVIRNADRVIVVSDGLKQEFSDRSATIDVIYNGFDTEDMQYEPWEDKNRKFTISSIGNFKPNQNVVAFWEVINDIKAEQEDFAKEVKISLTGNVDGSVIQTIEELDLKDMVEINGYVKHHEATQRMMTADMLLFIIPQTERNHLIITGKLFEYIASRTPIFAIGPIDGDASSIIKNAKRDPMIDYNNKESLKKRLLVAWANWQKAEKPIKHEEGDLLKFSRKGLTEQLANHLNQLHESN